MKIEKIQFGIPIGNYTSQFFANIYLNELDQYIKHTLRVKYYVRYMDDFVMLLEDKETCKTYKKINRRICRKQTAFKSKSKV